MDAYRFDHLTRSLVTAPSRRRVAKALAGGVGSGLLALLGGGAVAAKPAKVGVCHLTGDPANPIVYIQVDESAVAEHVAHGDAIAPDFLTDAVNCGGCAQVCAAVEECVDGWCRPLPVDCPTCGPGETCVDGICSCWVCPGGHGCLDDACVCSAAGTCDGDDPTPCGLLHGFIPMGCEDGCCCIRTGIGGGAYPCAEPGGSDPYCCSGWCGLDGGCACIPDDTAGLYPCEPGPNEHCCSGWCGLSGLCAPPS